MVNAMKKDRIVVLTTHNLEEADYLADRIMILQQGQVKAIGGSLFLKQSFGTGYQVRIITEKQMVGFVKGQITKVMQCMIYFLLKYFLKIFLVIHSIYHFLISLMTMTSEILWFA